MWAKSVIVIMNVVAVEKSVVFLYSKITNKLKTQ